MLENGRIKQISREMMGQLLYHCHIYFKSLYMDYNEEYRNTYYGYDKEEVQIPEQSGGGGGSDITPEDVQQMIDNALDGIVIEPKDEDTTQIVINGNETDIDDVYLTGVERDGDDVRFKLNNDRSDIVVDTDTFSDPNIDCSTF